MLATLCPLASPESARAAECDFTWILINTDGSKATPDQHAEKARREQECKQRLADERRDGPLARARLSSEFKIDAAKLSDREAIGRLQQLLDERKRAEDDAQAREEAIGQAQRASQEGKLMDEQREMLNGLGVKLDEDDAQDDAAIDPSELQMYQEMIKNGIAPECKGKNDQALIGCVDEVLEKE